VDDSEAIRIVMDAILQDMAIGDVHTCSSGESTLKSIKSRPDYFDLLFVDLNMPNMDGMELIRLLGDYNYKGGIIIASGMDKRVINLASDIARQNQVHLIGSIHKPITSEKLCTAIEKYKCFRERTAIPNKLLEKSEIIDAIEKGLLIPYYQPKVDIQTHTLLGIELLARIDAPGQGGTITPASFISEAESHNLINKLTYTLLHKALREFKEIKKSIPGDYTLAFNMCPTQLEELDTPKILDELIQHYDMQENDLVVEVTEERALKTSNQLETLNRLRMKGYGVALDDFGTGFTNISQLLNLPFSEIKIDRNLITDIHKDNFSQVIVNTLLEITQQLHIHLIAEGIESYAELQYLESLSKSLYLQGYIISKPKPKTEFIRWLQSWRKSKAEV
jgi:EAL domain-containing protein (putative c-di-GMP-specific phosphodiesterase class I)/FixJ family two-component response regulator